MTRLDPRYRLASAALCSVAPAVAVLWIADAILNYPAADSVGIGFSLALFGYYVVAIVVIGCRASFIAVVRSAVSFGVLAGAVAASWEAENLYAHPVQAFERDWLQLIVGPAVPGLMTFAAILLVLLAVPLMVEIMRRAIAPFG